MSQIEQVLSRLFAGHRVVLWYDDGGEMRGEYALLSLAGVKKVEVANNEFGLKRRILKLEPERKFLLYQSAPRPPDAENWLLDVLLANVQFHGDPDALILADLGLGDEFRPLVTESRPFFKAESRKAQLRALLGERDTLHQIRLKMCAVCAGLTKDPAVELTDIVLALFEEAAAERETRHKLLRDNNLHSWFWDRVQETWGYASPTRTPKDFAIRLFESGYAAVRQVEPPLKSPAAFSLLRRWKDSTQQKAAFEALSRTAADLLEVKTDAGGHNFRRLAENDLFEEVDRAILRRLVAEVAARTVSVSDVASLVERRRTTRWFDLFAHEYEAVLAASTLLDLIANTRLDVPSVQAGVATYARTWYRIDQAYRHFVYRTLASGQTSLFEALTNEVENAYSNKFLFTLANNWQDRVDALTTWPPENVPSQMGFFAKYVAPVLKGDTKLFVIVSDALRYEIADELLSRIRSMDRYEVEMSAAVSPLPSFTQLGMAALLPRDEPLRIDAETGTVYISGKSTAGVERRRALLRAAAGDKAAVLTAEEFTNMGWDGYRALYRDNRIVYLYHDVIDAVGHSLATEERVFSAAETAIEDIIRFVRKAANANFLNCIITADHGFLYQHRPIDESDFAATPVEGGAYNDRRFVLGASITQTGKHKQFTATELGLLGDFSASFPRGLLRLRKSGSSIRYVHGGLTLQEVVVPVLQVSKAKRSDIAWVDIQLVRSGTNIISTNQVAIRLFQVEPVSEKLQARRLRIGLFAQDGTPVSDSVTLSFASTDPEPGRREQTVHLTLNHAADTVNNKPVELRLLESVEGTSDERILRRESYTVRRTFGSDFEF